MGFSLGRPNSDSLGLDGLSATLSKESINASISPDVNQDIPENDPNLGFDSKQIRVLELLSNGIPAVDVAGIVQLSPSRISQMLAEPDFKQRLEDLNMAKMRDFIGMDSQMDRIERTALTNLERTIPMVMDPMKLVKIVGTINGLKRRTSMNGHSQSTAPTQVAILNIGQATLNRFIVNSQSEVIEVDGRPLLTMQSGQFRRFANETGNSLCSEEPSGTEVVDAFTGSRQEG